MHGASLRWIGTVNTAKKSGMCSVLICRCGAIAGRIACVLAAALLACASSAHAQVIEEGGFPVKGGGVSGEPFSLSCPPRLYVAAGESVLLSCSATAVPEEGVRYEWESPSGDGLHLLSDANERSPLFTAPVSGESAEYVYRLTAMSVGVYETATVTVMVGGFVEEGQEAFEAPGEECGSFGGFGRDQEGCQPWEKAPPPDSFGDSPEDEGIVPWPSFPESPGAEDKEFAGSSGAGPFPQAPPRLECPVAVFLEELETGQVECHAWDASGEEYLDYSWEPIGSTTRDYLDNPRLIPEDAPNPSVVAPETPAYETLESFHSGETMFRYRYRLTVTSRATGLSSSSEVEVFVSSSRPSVYCPLEVVVEEGETAQLDCEGVDPLSARMDYDEEGTSILWEWEGLWDTSMAPLAATDLSSPLFTAPPGSAGKTYHYIASMTSSASGMPRTARRKVTVTVVGEKDVSGRMNDPSLTFPRNPFTVTEWQRNVLFVYDSSAPDVNNYGIGFESIDSAPEGILQDVVGTFTGITFSAVIEWNNISDQAPCVDEKTTWEYKICLIDSGDPESGNFIHDIVSCSEEAVGDEAIADLSITILDSGNAACFPRTSSVACHDRTVYEGADNFVLDCSPTNEPPGATYSWTGTDIANRLTGTDGLTPTFSVPDNVDSNTNYDYTVTLSVDGYDRASDDVRITVRNKPDPSLTCTDSEVYEATADITLDCSVTNEPTGATYAWTARGSTSGTDDLSSTTILKPTFSVPADIPGVGNNNYKQIYEYTVTLSAAGIDNVTEDVTVTVLEKPDIQVGPGWAEGFFEGAGPQKLTCCDWISDINTYSGGTWAADLYYSYTWTAGGDTPNTDRLSPTDVQYPVFAVPDAVPHDTTFDYTLTLSAENADPGSVDYIVLVWNKPQISVTCDDPDDVNEGDSDVEFYCRASGGLGSNPQYTWSWFPTTNLTNYNTATPTFDVPGDIPQDTTYTYTVTATAVNSDAGRATVAVTVLNKESLALVCTPPSSVYEGSADVTLACTVANEPSGATYSWTGTDIANRLTGTTTLTPTFSVPGDIDEPGGANKDYDYTVTLSASGIDDVTEDVTVTVLEKLDIVPCGSFINGFNVFTVYEGTADFQFPHCQYTGAPDPAVYSFGWTIRGSTSSTAISLLSATDIERPFFRVPDAVSENKRYEYTMTVSADNADPFLMSYTVNVNNKPAIVVTCAGHPYTVTEGDDDITLDCSASGGPDGSVYSWSWSPTTGLTDHDTATPTFDVPDDIPQDTTYTYTVTVTAVNSDAGTATVTVTVRDKDPSLTCTDIDVYEGSADVTLACTVAIFGPSGATYSWTGTDIANRLTGTTTLTPTFSVPGDIDIVRGSYSTAQGSWPRRENKDYEYTVSLTVGEQLASYDVTVTVLEKPDIGYCASTWRPFTSPLPERSGRHRIGSCTAVSILYNDHYITTFNPDSYNVTSLWTAYGDTPNTDLLSSANVFTPYFNTPDNIAHTTEYKYLLTLSGENYDSSQPVRVYIVVEDVDNYPALSVACASVDPIYEGSADIALDCTASGAPSGSSYTYAWEARGNTSDTSLLSATDISSPTFYVPDEVAANERYEYLLTVSAANAEDAEAEVTVTVLDKRPLIVVCTPPSSVYEGSADIALDCTASGAPSGSSYTYAWEARGNTSDTSLLSATDISSPTFYVPDEVAANERYEYLLTVSAANAEDAEAEVTVTVLDKRPLIVVCTPPSSVYEGSADIALDCTASGAPSGSSYTYAWEARGNTSDTSLLSATDISSPTFYVPDEVAANERYEYLLTVSAANAEDAEAEVTVTVLDKRPLIVVCTPPSSVYEGSADIALDCTASGAPSGSSYTYAWEARGNTSDTSLLSATDISSPTFYVPDEVAANERYEYLLTVSAANAEDAEAEVTVTVLDKRPLIVVCTPPSSVYEGSADIALDCTASGAPSGSSYTYAWEARGNTSDTSLLSATDISSPTFYVPDEVAANERYEYLLTVSAANAEDAEAEVTVTVLDKRPLIVVCTPPSSVYEGSADIALDCTASGAPSGSSYTYAWEARGNTSDTSLLSATDISSPTFYVPDEVAANERYEYLLTVSAANAEDAEAEVTVTVLDKRALIVFCAVPASVYEGSADIALDCTASGAPSGSSYTYAWEARGNTSDTSLLSATDISSPTFYVPDEVDADETYEYLLTVSAQNAENSSVDVTLKVLDAGDLALACNIPLSVYEGSADVLFDCGASGAPGDNPQYTYLWTGDASSLALLDADDISSPTFSVPSQVQGNEVYAYTLTISAQNAEDARLDVSLTVLNKPSLTLVCTPPAPVYEGAADFDLDCSASGAPSGSGYEYVWMGRGATANTGRGPTQNMGGLSSTTVAKPTFNVPDEVDADERYEYLLTVSAENAEDAEAEVTVTVLDKRPLIVVCTPPSSVYEGSADIALDCTASGAPSGSSYTYAWEARGNTSDTSLLSATDVSSPTFYVPDEVAATTAYEYLLTVSAENAEDAEAEVTVTVLDKRPLIVVCTPPSSVYEGSADIALDCTASGAPSGSSYTYAWEARGNTSDTSLLSATDVSSPTFYVPDEVAATTAYEYLLTVSAENAGDAEAEVTVTVLNTGALALVCAAPGSVYEGSADIALDCTASGAPSGSSYTYAWEARGNTSDTSLLSATDISSPTFYVPDEVAATTAYEYLLTVSAENAEDAEAEVTVTVLNTGALALVCADPGSVYEGSADIALDCTASGAPSGSSYTYAWEARGNTSDTSLLSATDISSPTFYVPDEVAATTAYEYLLTVSAENAEDAEAEVTVTVLNTGALALVCADPGSVYEGSADIALDCTASGAPSGSSYTYAWEARGNTSDTSLLSATDVSSPTFYVPDEVAATTAYEYLLTVSAENAEDAEAEVTVTVLNTGALALVCADPGSVYEGSADIALDCTASGAPSGSSYTYAWEARGNTSDTSLLSATDVSSPTFYVPDEVAATTAYEYLLTASAENAEDAEAEVTVTVLNTGALALVCADPGSVYEGSADIALDCTASGAPSGSSYTYAWEARGNTSDTSLLSATDISSPTFYVPDEVAATTAYEYLLTVSAENAESGSAAVTVTVLNAGALRVVCADPPSVYEGSEDISLNCTASGAPSDSDYAYAWTARGNTPDTSLLSATDIASPVFLVPDEVAATTAYEYLLTVSAANAEDAEAEVAVTVLDRAPLALVDDSIAGRVYIFTVGEVIADILLPQATGGLPPYAYTLTPVLPPELALDDPTRTISGTPLEVSPRTEYTWQVVDANNETVHITFFIEVVPAADTTSPPVAESSREVPEPSALGVTVSVSSLDFGVQSADTQVSLDPMTDQISTRVSGPYHAGRMTLSPGGSEEIRENGEMALSIELASPVVLRREGGIDAASIILAPNWSLAESCEQLSSQTIGGLYTEVTLSDADCPLLRFGGELDLTDVPSGRYAGSMDIILRSGESEETHSVDVEVTVVPAQRVITIGPGGVRFSTSRELPAGLTEEQNLSIYPHIAFLTEEQPHGVFELSNPSLIPLEVSVSARFGYTEATENGREVVVEDTLGSRLGDLSKVVDIRPGVLVLMPGEKGLVRYGMKEGALTAMAEKGYAAFFDVVSEPRQYVRSDRMPEEVTGEKTARVTMRVPGVYVPGEGALQLRATLLSISYVGSLSATFLVETQDHPFVGEVVAYDGDGRELGRRETLVYTRSHVRVPLDRMPEEGAVFLRFSPRGSGRVPEPTSVEWDAPRRDIGAEDKDRATTTETLARKP